MHKRHGTYNEPMHPLLRHPLVRPSARGSPRHLLTVADRLELSFPLLVCSPCLVRHRRAKKGNPEEPQECGDRILDWKEVSVLPPRLESRIRGARNRYLLEADKPTATVSIAGKPACSRTQVTCRSK